LLKAYSPYRYRDAPAADLVRGHHLLRDAQRLGQLHLGQRLVPTQLRHAGGSLELANATDGGLIVHIRLKRV
jgi:hypothetical protein